MPPERRLREWSLIKDIDSGRPWNSANLIEASEWPQRHLAEHTASQHALTIPADQERTRRTGNAAHARLKRRLS